MSTVVTPIASQPLKPGAKWSPILGEQANGVVQRSLSDPKARGRADPIRRRNSWLWN